MTLRAFVVAAVVLSAILVNPSDSAAQRQRWPGDNGGGRQQEGGGGRERQRENGGGPQRENGGGPQRENGGSPRRENGGGGQRDDSGARPQGGGRPQGSGRPQGGGQAEVRTAQPRADQGDRGNGAPSTALRAGRRETPSEAQNIAPPPQQTPSTPAPLTRSDAGSSNDGRVVRRRYPTAADRANVSGGTGTAGNNGAIVRNPANSSGVARSDNNVRYTSRVAVPRVGPPPGYYHDKGYYDRKYYSRGYYSYRRYSHGNIYVVPYGRTYYYYPRYYYNPYAFGYGPAGYGHVYFDLHYNSHVWHPYSVYRAGTYGNYGYPVGELRLKVHPRDAQVYIDGYYAGRVDDFDGVFQSLKLEEGEYQVEIVLPGYEALAFNVRILPGEKTTYEGDLIREP